MNSLWNNNIALFASRFPSLASLFSAQIAAASSGAPAPFWTVTRAKNGSICVSENGKLLHSSYNPEREAQAAVEKACASCSAAVFESFGAGYAPVAFASAHPDRRVIIIESDPAHFFAALSLIDWTPVFRCRSCIIALACPPDQAVALINQTGISECAFFSVPAQTAHAQQYFDTLHTLIARNRRKDEINTATLARFAPLWLANICTNLPRYGELDGVNMYENRAGTLPFLLIAAGPSLEYILPYLRDMGERAVTVCVDTALRSCLRAGLEPDFIIIGDPQYYAWRHIAGLSSPSSVLITESAVYPPVFRFACRKKTFCSSLFPLGQWFEHHLGSKGDLGAGGSVSSQAWNFAHLAGARTVYTAGLDLAFPGGKTHIRGSTFEEAVHALSRRTGPAETACLSSLYSAGTEYGKAYDGTAVLTDSRMKMFAWWFESRLASCPETATYTFCPQGLAVPGIMPADVHALLSQPVITAEKAQFLSESEKHGDHPSGTQFQNIFASYRRELQTLHDDALAGNDSGISQNTLKDAVFMFIPEQLRSSSYPYREIAGITSKMMMKC